MGIDWSRKWAKVALLLASIVVGLAGWKWRSALGWPAESLGAAASSAPSPDPIDRETPRRTMANFLREAREGDYRVAASYLDLRGVLESRRDVDGPDLAQKLAYVLERRRTLSLTQIPDQAEGEANAKPGGRVVAVTLYVGEDPVPIALERVRFPDGIERWLIARSTVDAIPALDGQFGLRPIGIPIPASLTRMTLLGNEAWQWLGILFVFVVAYGVARALAALIVRAASLFTHRPGDSANDALVESARRPLRMVIGALVFRLLIEPLQLTAAVLDAAGHGTYTLLVVGVSWLMLRGLGAATSWLDDQAAHDASDLLRGRRMRTQTMILRRLASITIGFFAAAFVLIQFEFVRSVGVSLLASAGVAGVVVGFAAQRSLAAIVAGIQFSFAQPVRVGDQIVIEGEFGEVEDIYLTYAVVRVWDKRRIVVPVTYFLEKPFQNWTRSGTDLLGFVLLKVDFGMPVEVVRQELRRVCESDPLWDKKTCLVQVTDSDAVSVTLRALVSAADASKLWALKCNVRERLIAFMRDYEGGRALPLQRQQTVEATRS
ncbi:MAG: mechanosensitive ion channel domain-containing protein [Polyangiaceae bacterium]|jgi:small-conductance mechanosensitive channel